MTPNVEPARWSFGDVHVWLERVDARPERGELGAWLDDDEQARARRFRFERDRARFVARRAFLRRILAGYLGVPPATIRYRVTPLGRPELDPSFGVTFSTSHADGLAMLAVAPGLPVGLDVERVRPIADALDLAQRFFSPPEHLHLSAIAEEDRSAGFLRLWTRKESCVKAIGAGMSMAFSEFNVLDDDRGRVRLGGPSGPTALALASIDDPPGYVGSVAVLDSRLELEQVAALAAAS